MANMKKDVPIIIEVNIGGNLQAVFGRTRKVLPGGHLIAMHMVPITTIEDKDLILEKCPGCNAATWLDVPEVMFSHLERVRIPCIIMTNVRNASTFSRNKWQNGINQDDMISQFLEVGAYRPMTNRLQLCKNRLTTARGAKLNIYIDGSVKNNKTENIEAIFGLMIYDEDNKLLDTIMSTVENWITVNKTEALALLAALLIIPENKKATIYTDSQTNYNNFMDIKQRPHRNNLRDILKFGSSNYIWAIIKEIISKEKLDIEVIKIKAHATDTLHNILDIEIKERYVDIHNVNKLEVLPTCKEYRYVLRWNETIVETNIRRFIRLITRIQGLEKFFNLNRNDKYRMLEIDWHVTFEYLNVNEEYETYFKTNAHSSKCKRMKYKD
uniref:RNase H type-1 domain-containing protein n=1 Tax=Rhizophagus irregularis (strain DAOM 181602 / DAOM 197198 / MUCL 43194) TaxID=747089 RepID=U9SXH4_RHIID